MGKLLLAAVVVVFAITLSISAAEVAPKRGDVLWANALDSDADFAQGQGAGAAVALGQRKAVLRVVKPTAQASALHQLPLPVERLRGQWVYLSADVKAQDVSAKPVDWNGVKVMLKIECTAQTHWPQVAIPVGTFDWKRLSTRVLIPQDATAITLILGLESVSGTVWFDELRLTVAKISPQVAAAPADKPIFKGHTLPALRGAMVHPRMTQQDLRVLAEDWGGNLVRWQLLYMPKPGTEHDLALYDQWLEREMAYLDQVLTWAKAYGVKVVVDLHSPPGGLLGGSGTVASSGPFWTNPKSQAHFVSVWQRLAKRYADNPTVWGYDLLNEPDDRTVTEDCDDWQALALRAGQAVRQIDPGCTLIVEPPDSGGAPGFIGFAPINLPNVVYSFHMYWPIEYTHQGVLGPPATLAYPGRIGAQRWDKAALAASMAPAVAFAKQHRVHLYVGEFSAIRWAPGAEQYLADVIDLFESHGWDWSYHAFREWHGWNVEVGSDQKDPRPGTTPTQRQKVLRKWLAKNQQAK
ncbi:MAG: cellulase family glycosylhydrolase [Phycisphaeraceae bacterium]